MSEARALPCRVLASLPVAGDVVRVSLAGGDVSLVWLLDPPLPGGSVPWLNRFARRGTAAELRALAAVLDGLVWVDDTTVEGA